MRGRLRAHAAALGNPTSRAVSVTALPGEADIRKGVLYEQSLEPRFDARQLTLRGVVIGVLGCVIITASSAYTALKMGALPWPIIFAAVISLFFLKLMGNASLNEANVTHTIMSAGAMVAGGLAFTIPGAWMLGYADQISWLDMFIVALAGTILGLLATALIHRHFIVDAALEFPTGNAAAQTLRATEAGGKTGKQLFGSMAIAGIYSVLRDALGVVPSMLCTLNIPGVTFAIYNSPMLLSIGFLVGFAPVAFWFAGALLGNFGIIVSGTAAGLFDVMTAQGIVKSLGMGLMMGFGVAVVLKDILPQVAGIVRGLAADSSTDTDEQSLISGSLKLDAGIIGLGAAAIAVIIAIVLDLGPVPAVIVTLFTFVTTIMSAQSCGQTGIDPMEIFGLIVMLIVAAFAQLAQVKLFFIAGIVAVACGLAGDVMNDFKAGAVLGTNPRAQWIGQAIGGIVGAWSPPPSWSRSSLPMVRTPLAPTRALWPRRQVWSPPWSRASRACRGSQAALSPASSCTGSAFRP